MSMLRDGDYVRVRQGAPYLAANKAGEFGRVDGFCRNVPSVSLPSEHGASIGIDAEFLDVIDPLFYFAAKDAELAKLREQRDRLLALVESLRPGHYMCDHTTETCPRFHLACADDAECTCGADVTNAGVDGVLKEIGNG